MFRELYLERNGQAPRFELFLLFSPPCLFSLVSIFFSSSSSPRPHFLPQWAGRQCSEHPPVPVSNLKFSLLSVVKGRQESPHVSPTTQSGHQGDSVPLPLTFGEAGDEGGQKPLDVELNVCGIFHGLPAGCTSTPYGKHPRYFLFLKIRQSGSRCSCVWSTLTRSALSTT